MYHKVYEHIEIIVREDEDYWYFNSKFKGVHKKYPHIRLATEADRAFVHKKNLAYRIKDTKFKNLPVEKLEEILEIISRI